MLAMMAHLAARHGLVRLDAAGFGDFAAGAGDRVVLFVEDPVRVPESWDALVLLPELLKLQPGRLSAGLPDLEAARQFAPRYGLARWPALLFLRDGGYVGAIEGLRDWDDYRREFAEQLARPVGRAPLALRAEAATGCR
jgi:hydrogenase-1 operon protein HyaE